MCGRYVLALRPSQVRTQLEDSGMPVEEAPEDEDTRQSYNVAPGYHELVYRADVPHWGAGERKQRKGEEKTGEEEEHGSELEHADAKGADQEKSETKYKLQAMKWGLIPFWTKRNPDYGSMMRTINCRDDSLIENRGMWNTMKQRKRCIVVCQGFFEWLKKNGGKEKIPHYVKRKDGQLMCFAGLWDCVQFEGSEEKLFTYTIITTSSNDDLKFLHDRMPVILENGSDAIKTWLDPERSTWSKELQSLLKPFKGELDVYPVNKDVGKVGNNSPSFIVPLTSSENKNNIANFFANQKTQAKDKVGKDQAKRERAYFKRIGDEVKQEPGEDRKTINQDGSENNAPLPGGDPEVEQTPIKHERDEEERPDEEPAAKSQKISPSISKDQSPSKSPDLPSRKTRSATSNRHAEKSPSKASPPKATNGSQKITNFFNK